MHFFAFFCPMFDRFALFLSIVAYLYSNLNYLLECIIRLLTAKNKTEMCYIFHLDLVIYSITLFINKLLQQQIPKICKLYREEKLIKFYCVFEIIAVKSKKRISTKETIFKCISVWPFGFKP